MSRISAQKLRKGREQPSTRRARKIDEQSGKVPVVPNVRSIDMVRAGESVSVPAYHAPRETETLMILKHGFEDGWETTYYLDSVGLELLTRSYSNPVTGSAFQPVDSINGGMCSVTFAVRTCTLRPSLRMCCFLLSLYEDACTKQPNIIIPDCAPHSCSSQRIRSKAVTIPLPQVFNVLPNYTLPKLLLVVLFLSKRHVEPLYCTFALGALKPV